MNSSTQNVSIADYYFGFLENLNAESKLDLISKLSLSLKKDEELPKTSLESIFGAYESDDTADEIIAEIRKSRISNRIVESL